MGLLGRMRGWIGTQPEGPRKTMLASDLGSMFAEGLNGTEWDIEEAIVATVTNAGNVEPENVRRHLLVLKAQAELQAIGTLAPSEVRAVLVNALLRTLADNGQDITALRERIADDYEQAERSAEGDARTLDRNVAAAFKRLVGISGDANRVLDRGLARLWELSSSYARETLLHAMKFYDVRAE